MPEGFEYLWRWFWEVVSSNDLTYTELKNWSCIAGVTLRPWEAAVLKNLDRILRTVQRG